jgi:hypothetical protein
MVGVCQLLTLHRNKWRALITNSNFAGCMTANLRAFRPSEFARSIAAE